MVFREFNDGYFDEVNILKEKYKEILSEIVKVIELNDKFEVEFLKMNE